MCNAFQKDVKLIKRVLLQERNKHHPSKETCLIIETTSKLMDLYTEYVRFSDYFMDFLK